MEEFHIKSTKSWSSAISSAQELWTRCPKFCSHKPPIW